MKTLHADLEALMPEPYIRRATFGGLFTAAQMRAAIIGATERAAKLAATLAYDAAIKYADGYVVDFEDIGDAIRGTGGHKS